MTGKRYYEDSHLRDFCARVVSCVQGDGGWEVILDSTAFYPEGGGQACDTGTLGGVKVLHTRERGEDVIHLCDGPLEPGTQVEGQICWQRRFDQMQQHTGEHVLSGVMHRRYGCANVGFHVGAELVTVDFDRVIPAEEIPRVEGEVNGLLWQNLPVECWVPSPEELPGVTYRAKRALPWPVRIVRIPGADSCACCGVHVAATGEVGLMKIFSCVKFHQGVRLEVAWGGRAMALLNTCFQQNRQVSQAFSAKIWETGEAARRMNEALAKERLRGDTLQRQINQTIAESYGNQKNALHFAPGLSPAQVRELAEAIAGQVTGVAAVFSGGSGCLMGEPSAVKALGEALRSLGARGGGKSGVWQGSVNAPEGQIRAIFLEIL